MAARLSRFLKVLGLKIVPQIKKKNKTIGKEKDVALKE
jgi:hypothetical protein